MAIRITKHGQVPRAPDQIVKGTCRRCSTEFEFERGLGAPYMDRNDTGVKIYCPLPGCGNEVWISDDAIARQSTQG